jgi:hypothetical protein
MAENPLTTKKGNTPYLVYHEEEVIDITCAQSPGKAISYICRRNPEFDTPEARPRMSAVVLTEELYKKVKAKLKRKRNRKVKVLWQPLLFGRPFGSPTMAVTQKRAGCNRWYTKKKSKENPTTEETKTLYHEGVSARPLFGNSAKQPQYHPRKASHVKQLSLIPDHHK